MPAALFLALALAGQAAETEVRTAPCALAPGLREGLQKRFGSSRVLSFADLYEDERALFRAEHPGVCPGLVSGRFFGLKERPAVALVLLDVGPKKEVRLVVARPALSTWTFHEIESLAQGSTPVVLKGVPGRPAELDEVAPSGGLDVVGLFGYDSWFRGYRWNGRTFERPSPQN